MIKTASFSTLKDYETCPHRVYLNKVEKHRDQGNEFTARGNEEHTKIEQFLGNKTDNLELEHHADRVERIRTLPQQFVDIEQHWGFDAFWTDADYWADPWLRIKCDVFTRDPALRSGNLIDWKTGKKSHVKHTDQATLYTIAAFQRYSELDCIETNFCYIDTGETLDLILTRRATEPLRPMYEARINKMLLETEFRPKPTRWNCNYCSMREHCDYRYEE